MTPIRIGAALGGALGLLIAVSGPVRAQDASFGCKVLLCALASNPNWRGVPYCVPVMTRLFEMLRRKGGGWPPCQEAASSAPGYEPYADCPVGFAAATRQEERWRLDQNGEACIREAPAGSFMHPGAQPAGSDERRLEIRTRERRAEPWFIDIDADGQRRRFYFSLAE